jgi:hypothetical protein
MDSVGWNRAGSRITHFFPACKEVAVQLWWPLVEPFHAQRRGFLLHPAWLAVASLICCPQAFCVSRIPLATRCRIPSAQILSRVGSFVFLIESLATSQSPVPKEPKPHLPYAAIHRTEVLSVPFGIGKSLRCLDILLLLHELLDDG